LYLLFATTRHHFNMSPADVDHKNLHAMGLELCFHLG
jgi:hypothetical protein